LLAVRDSLFNIFTATLHTVIRSSIHSLRTGRDVVTGTHLSLNPYVATVLFYRIKCYEASATTTSSLFWRSFLRSCHNLRICNIHSRTNSGGQIGSNWQGSNSNIEIFGNKVPSRRNRLFLLQVLLFAQHVSGTVLPIIRMMGRMVPETC